MSGVTENDSPEPASPLRVVDRLRRAGLSDERIQQHLGGGAIRVDGEQVTDLDRPAPQPARPIIVFT
jgi:hypothetical protein